jgi:hypothetical protein
MAIKQVWLKTGEQKYYDYIKRNIDEFVGPNGDIRTYRLEEYNLDQINEGKLLFLLYDTTGDKRYKRAAYLLRKQLQTHPRTTEGGFWHKQIYPHQMWLDGIYIAAPLYAEFAKTFDEPEEFDDVAHQIVLIERHIRDPESGLLYHGWDESKSQKWADPKTGCSLNFWGRAIGWYTMALSDVLDHLPADHPERDRIVSIFQSTVSAVAAVQDKSTGAIKLHAWRRLEQDAELCHALRKTVGDDIELMYDASSMFNIFEDAVWFGRQLEKQGFFWYEEPMDHFNMTALARLAAELDIPLAVAEATYGGPWDALAQIKAGASDTILTDPLDAYKGGFTGVMKTAHICEGFGIMCAIHGSSIAPGLFQDC